MESYQMKLDTSGIDDILQLPSGPLDEYRSKASFDWKKFKLLLEGETMIKFKYSLWKRIESEPIFYRTPWQEMTRAEYRHVNFLRVKKLLEFNFISEEEFLNEPKLLPAALQCINQYDVSLAAKKFMAIDNFLQGLKMSRQPSHKKIYEDTIKFKAMGALTITEMSHGSNVKAIRTRATYDPQACQFVLHTPDIEATKVYSGVLGQTATHAIVYAQLYTPDAKCHGFHQFLVPIRDQKTLLPFEGVKVGDMGPKIGMNGMDNGFVQFNNYRIGKDALLNRHADLTDDGRYVLKTKDGRSRINSALGILSLGRICLTYSCSLLLQQAVVIAIRYSAVRRQFGQPNDSTEQVILEYQSQQWRLFPYLAACYVIDLYFFSLYEDYSTLYGAAVLGLDMGIDVEVASSEMHALSCVGKAAASWIARDGIQECREACGGHGYLKASRLDELRRDHDANNTHEGDGHVMTMQTSNCLLKTYQEKVKKSEHVPSAYGSFTFLNDFQSILKRKMKPRLETIQDIIDVYHYLICCLLVECDLKVESELEKSGGSLFHARNNSQAYYLRQLAVSFFECNALIRFNRFAIDPMIPTNIAKILNSMGMLFGLWTMEKYFGFLYERGDFIDKNQRVLAQLREDILDYCKRLLPESVALVDVISPPDFILNSSLGYADGKIYENIFKAITSSENSMERVPWYKEFTENNINVSSKL